MLVYLLEGEMPQKGKKDVKGCTYHLLLARPTPSLEGSDRRDGGPQVEGGREGRRERETVRGAATDVRREKRKGWKY